MKTIICTAVVLAAGAPAMAQGAYFSGGGSVLDIDGDVLLNPDGDYQAGAITGIAGFDFNRVFGAELEVNVGVSDAEETDDFFGTEDTISVESFAGVYARAGIPLNRLWIGARAGAVGGEFELEVRDQFSGDVEYTEGSVDGVGYGGVVTLDLRDNIFLRGDYTIYELESEGGLDFDATSVAVTVGMRF